MAKGADAAHGSHEDNRFNHLTAFALKMFSARLLHRFKEDAFFWISAAGALTLHLVIAWRSLSCLEGFSLLYSNGPLFDDSYIYFKMSRDLAEWYAGCNPSIQLSSGFQPLIALCYSLFFSLFWSQPDLPIHWALSFNAALGFGAHVAIYFLLRRVVSRAAATFLVSIWMWSTYVMVQTVNGMETTLALLMLLVTLLYYWNIRDRTENETAAWIALGGLIGIGFWSRVDLGFLGIAIAVDLFWRSRQGGRSSAVAALRRIGLSGCTALVIALPWIIFTIMSTGHILPVSGSAVQHITSVFFDFMGKQKFGFSMAMLSYLGPEFKLFQPFAGLSRNHFWQLCISVLALAGLIFGLKDRLMRSLLRPFLFFQLMTLICYVLLIGGFWHFNRYLYPTYILILFFHAATLRTIELKFKRHIKYLPLVLSILFVPYALSYWSQYHTFFSNPRPARYLSLALFAKDKVPRGHTVGAFQSGCLSYYLDNRVVNLDGVINEQAHVHLKNKSLADYLQKEEIEYIIEEEFLFNMWDAYLRGQISAHYGLVAQTKRKGLPMFWQTVNIYKRKPAASTSQELISDT